MMNREAFRPIWACTAFSLSPDLGLPEPAKREKGNQTRFFLCADTSNWGSRKTFRVGIILN